MIKISKQNHKNIKLRINQIKNEKYKSDFRD